MFFSVLSNKMIQLSHVKFVSLGLGMKRPAEEDYNSNVHTKRPKEESGGPQLTLRLLLQSKVRSNISRQVPTQLSVPSRKCFSTHILKPLLLPRMLVELLARYVIMNLKHLEVIEFMD